MSDFHIRKIQSTIEKQFSKKIDLSDVESKPEDKQNDAFLTRALMAFALKNAADIPEDIAALAVTDEYQDNGIDAAFYNAKERTVYLGQSKLRKNGKGSIDRGEIQKFLKGFKDFINARWNRFGPKMRQKTAEMEAALDDANTQFVLVLAYTGDGPLSKEVTTDIEDCLRENNSPTEIVTTRILKLTQLWNGVAQRFSGATISLEIALQEWGQMLEPFESFYGRVAAQDVAEWFRDHNNALFTPNIRLFLGATGVNGQIADTLRSSPDSFWYFNNGICALCDSIKKKPLGGTSRTLGIFECENVQIVNGAQTVGAIAEAFARNETEASSASVPIRLISLKNTPEEFAKQVTRYNNTQNRIDRRDFVALDSHQERIRIELLVEGVTYLYKSGETMVPSERGVSLDEATVALACAQSDVGFAVQAKREIGKLWEDIEKAPYAVLFNAGVNGQMVWDSVQTLRAVETALTNQDLEGRDRLIAVHGNRFITHLVFQQIAPGVPLDKREDKEVIVANLYNEVREVVNSTFPDAYPANLFKNATKCARLKELLSDMTGE